MGDGLTFVSAPFAAETEITGPIAARIWVSSSTVDADLFLVFRVFTPDLREVTFVGAIDPKSGMFTPALDGPNPERSGDRNNIGDVWVVAEFTPESAREPIRSRAHLLVAPPVFMRWVASEVGK